MKNNRTITRSIVFVYGTLMQGQGNHDYFLQENWFRGNAEVSGFEMYDIGSFPGVVAGEGRVLGEVYEVPAEALDRLDQLEGEGSLYIREWTSIVMESGEQVYGYIYVYNHEIDDLDRIPEWAQPYTADWRARTENRVWYVSYGSNMLKERFMHYIEGGSFPDGGACHEPCADTSAPLAVKTFDIPYDMYFRNNSYSWDGGGVSFLDITRPGSAKGVAYLITREQFEHVACQENGGSDPEMAPGWYNTIVSLGTMDGCEVVTITNDRRAKANHPATSYIETLRRGLEENYPDMTRADVAKYLMQCQNNRAER